MSTYDDCVSIHAEMNAIAYADRSSMEGGTMYVTSTVCWSCAKVIANSGIRNVVMVGDPEHNYSHRNIDRTIEFLKSCGIGVEVR
jgi:deoxycytidylate deaminase